MNRLVTLDLTVGYASGRREVLTGVELEVAPGQLVALLGRNGSGKSTLLATLAGLQAPLAGRVEIDGERLDDLSPRQRARRIAIVRAGPGTTGSMRAHEVVALGRHPHTGWWGRLDEHDHRVVEQALAATGAAPFAERRVANLSDGERQKVVIARALAQEPSLLLLDEPTAFLDLPGRLEIMRLLRTITHDDRGRSAILAIHDLDLALRYADRLWVIDGDTIQAGSPAVLRADGVLERAFGIEV